MGNYNRYPDPMPGDIFGKLEVIGFSHRNKRNDPYYTCKCNGCGKEKPYKKADLYNGRSKQCHSCSMNWHKKTLEIGQKFEQWTVEEFSHIDKRGSSVYKFRCECGNTRLVKASALEKIGIGCKSCKLSLKPKKKDLVRPGCVFNSWTVLKYTKTKNKKDHYLCQCNICGNKYEVDVYQLLSGLSRKCKPCSKRETSTKHGHGGDKYGNGKTGTHGSWNAMKERCTNPNHISYKNYGGRGITVCERWLKSFKNFLEDMGEKPSDEYTIDRIDTNGNYEPSNCRWATDVEQARNRRTNHYITYNGKKQCLADWAEDLGIPVPTLNSRINMYKWSIDKAFTHPYIPRKRRK